jgi:hypothetical protein
MRTAGPAVEVLRGRSWYVDFNGVTQVSPRIPVPYDPTSVDVLSWDPERQRAEVASDGPIVPGSIILDPRFGQVMVRDVELTFGESGARGFVWCTSGASVSADQAQLGKAIADLVRAAIPLPYLRSYRYRVVSQAPDGTIILQAAIDDPSAGAPPLAKIKMWSGMAGVSAKLSPKTEIVLEFAGADPSHPMVTHFDATIPLELSLEAIAKISLGGTAAVHPVAKADAMLTWVTSLLSAIAAIPGAGSTFTTAMAAPTAALTTNLPSPKAFAV